MILASSLWIGGAETVIRHLAQEVDRRRFNVTVCHLKQRGHIGDELLREGVDVIGVSDSPEPKVDYLTFRKVLKIIRARRIDVVHTHTAHGLVDACLCKLLTPGLRVIHTFHFGNYPHTQPRIMWMERIFSRIADRLFAVGDVQRRQLQKVYGFKDAAIGTVWNGVTMPTGQGDPSFRARVGSQNRLLVGTIATFIDQKGLPDLLRVARRVRDAGHDAGFAVVGEGHLRPQLEAQRRELGLDDNVALTGWTINAAVLALPTFDVFFQPSLWEAMSVVILEAMAAGKPIVATRVGENSEIIQDGVDGLLVDPRDVEGMAVALGRVLGDAGLRQRLGAAARRKVEQKFTVEHMARAYERIYLDVLR
jgi:glycosyltransferase involved in cell wall biosynthesis